VRIRADRDLSDEAKRRKLARANEVATEEHRRLVEEQRQQTAHAVEQAERSLLGISYPEYAKAHEKAIIAMTYRDARDRAERAASDRENTEALADMLDRAEKSGDAQLAEAVFHVATTRGARNVADRYLEGRPGMQRRWESYVAARREAESIRGLLIAVMPPRSPSA
jgi:hypothetical protein